MEEADGVVDDDWALLCAEVHLELATALAASRPRVAVGHGRHALAVFEPIGAPQRFAAQQLPAELGADESGPGPLDAPTSRERAILRLVAQGMSNRRPRRGCSSRLGRRSTTSARSCASSCVQRRSEAAVFAATLGR